MYTNNISINTSSVVAPIVIVLSVSIIHEGIEDYARAKLDKEQNSEPISSYIDGN